MAENSFFKSLDSQKILPVAGIAIGTLVLNFLLFKDKNKLHDTTSSSNVKA